MPRKLSTLESALRELDELAEPDRTPNLAEEWRESESHRAASAALMRALYVERAAPGMSIQPPAGWLPTPL